MKDKLNVVTGTESLKKFLNPDYLSSALIETGKEPILTIDAVLFGKTTLDGGRKEDHLVLSFKEKKAAGVAEVLPLILNSTNQKTLEKLYGKGADVLKGKPIQLYVDPNVRAVGGGITEGIRIRPKAPVVQKAPLTPTSANWSAAIKAVVDGTTTIGAIRGKYALTDEHAQALTDAAHKLQHPEPEQSEPEQDTPAEPEQTTLGGDGNA